jgi:hypothetical protein
MWNSTVTQKDLTAKNTKSQHLILGIREYFFMHAPLDPWMFLRPTLENYENYVYSNYISSLLLP